MDDLDDIANMVSKGKCVLFLGAGVHAPPPKDGPWNYDDSKRPPFGGDLSEALAKECGFPDDYRKDRGLPEDGEVPRDVMRNLPLISQFYELKKSRQQLSKRFKEAVQTGKSPSPAVQALAELPFPLVITTNYDTHFEDSMRRHDKDPVMFYYKAFHEHEATPDLEDDVSAEQPAILKIHGDVHHGNMVATDEDYIQFVLRMNDSPQFNPIPVGWRSELKKKATLYIGYSLVDYNLRLLLNLLRSGVARDKFPISYSVDKYPIQWIQKVYEDQRQYVRFIANDVWTFVPELYKRVMDKDMPQ